MSWRYALYGSDRYGSSIADRYSYLYRQSPSRLESSTSSSPSSSHDYNQTTGRHLQRILHYPITTCRPSQRLRRTEYVPQDVDCDEVYPGIYIGNASSAKNKSYVRMMGFTHILNAAEGCRYGQVDTGHIYYYDMPNIRYLGLKMIDAPTTDISQYFYMAALFIDGAISTGGKVLVHCLVGMSRSATCVLAYLMICRKMSAADAIRTVRMCRDIRPNDGFLQQLADLDMNLKRQHLYSY